MKKISLLFVFFGLCTSGLGKNRTVNLICPRGYIARKVETCYSMLSGGEGVQSSSYCLLCNADGEEDIYACDGFRCLDKLEENLKEPKPRDYWIYLDMLRK